MNPHSPSLPNRRESSFSSLRPASQLDCPGENAKMLLASRILVVDDERVNVILLQSLLGRAGYTNIVATTNSLEVADLCSQGPPALVLLDVMMPHRDGFGVLEDLGLLYQPQRPPVLMLTADTSPETRRRALTCGANAFLTKPYSVAQVVQTVRQLLEQA